MNHTVYPLMIVVVWIEAILLFFFVHWIRYKISVFRPSLFRITFHDIVFRDLVPCCNIRPLTNLYFLRRFHPRTTLEEIAWMQL